MSVLLGARLSMFALAILWGCAARAYDLPKVGQLYDVDGARFSILELLGGNQDFGSMNVFRVRRLDIARGDDTILKVSGTRREDSWFWLPNEKIALDQLRAVMPAPNVYFTSADSSVMEKEFVRGTLLWKWFRDASRLPCKANVDRMFTVLRYFELVTTAGMTILDDSPSNAVFDEISGEVVIFDPGEIRYEARDQSCEQALDSRLFSSIASQPYLFFLWKLSALSLDELGEVDVAKDLTHARMKAFGETTFQMFSSIYGLNDFAESHPELRAILLAATRTSRRRDVPMLGSSRRSERFIGATRVFEKLVETAFLGLRHDEQKKMADLIFENDLPGRAEIRRRGWSPIAAKARRGFKRSCELLLGG